MPKKGKQKQAAFAPEEAPATFTKSSQPLPEIPEKQEEDGWTSPLDNDWGMNGGEMEQGHQNYEEIKPVHVKTPSVSASVMASNLNANSKSAQAEHASVLASALNTAFSKQSAGEKVSRETKAGKSELSKPESKGGVTWDDGRWDDNPGGKEPYRAKTSWGDDERSADEGWRDNGVDYDDWEGGQGQSGRGNTNRDDDWDHHPQAHAAGQSNVYRTAPAAPSKPQQPAQAWMSWREEVKKLPKVTDATTSSVGSRNVLSPQQHSQILRSLLNQPQQSYSAQHQVLTDPYASWGPDPHDEQAWNQPGTSAKHAQQNGQAWHYASTKAGPYQGDHAWANGTPKSGYGQRTESAWYSTGPAKAGYAEQVKTQKPSQQPDKNKPGKRGKRDKDDYPHRRGRSQTRTSTGWGESSGNDRVNDGSDWRNDGNDWNKDGNDWDRGRGDWDKGGTDWRKGGDDWNRGGDDWNRGGDDWNRGGQDWDEGGNDWDKGGKDWDKGGQDWDKGGKDWNKGGNDWGDDWDKDRGNGLGSDWRNSRNKDDEAWDHRMHFTPKSNMSNPVGPTYDMPSKTMAHAYSSLPSDFPRRPVQNSMNEYADVRFMESKGAALEPVRRALFGRARFAKDRIHWMFPSDKDERVASLLGWIQRVSYGLAGFGLHKFLQSRERGALVANADYQPDKLVNEPYFDWLTFDQLQQSRDRTLQESVAFYDPSVQVIVFVFLPSRSGNSLAMWRRKLKVPNNLRLTYQREISLALSTLRKEKDYVVHVDELPNKKDGRRASLPSKLSDSKGQKPKSKWWQIFR